MAEYLHLLHMDFMEDLLLELHFPHLLAQVTGSDSRTKVRDKAEAKFDWNRFAEQVMRNR